MKLLIILVLLALHSCINYEDKITAAAQQVTKISPEALVSTVSSQDFKKQLVVMPGDTVIFMGNVFPTRNTKLNTSFWHIDGELNASSLYLTKWTFHTPGKHLGVFNIVDIHGDLLCDTAVVWVHDSPQIVEPIFPANFSTGIPFAKQDKMTVHWQSSKKNNDFNLKYHFSLFEFHNEEAMLLFDSTLTNSHITLSEDLKPMQKYLWTLKISDDLMQSDSANVQNLFYTRGSNHEALLLLKISKNGKTNGDDSLWVNLSHSGGDISIKIPQQNQYEVKNLNPGTYSLTLTDSLFTEYQSLKKTFILKNHDVYSIDTMLLDLIAPQIYCINCINDTVDFIHNLPFLITDDGSGVAEIISVQLNGIDIPYSFNSLNDTLFIPPPHWELLPSIYQLQISVKDFVDNVNQASFWVRK
ncbi:MAG: hypothetical protein GX801_02280 [Fibrobacter sp.]|nr:hypothetical protein [Fibrobacter sp.]